MCCCVRKVFFSFFFLRIVGALCSFPVLLSLALIIFSLFPALANKQTWRAAPIQHSPDTQKHTPKKKKKKTSVAYTGAFFFLLFILVGYSTRAYVRYRLPRRTRFSLLVAQGLHFERSGSCVPLALDAQTSRTSLCLCAPVRRAGTNNGKTL